MAEAAAARLTLDVAQTVTGHAAAAGIETDVVSRGDSTLRGHVVAEVRAVQQARQASSGRGYDGVLFAPAYLESGRMTVGDVHYAETGGEFVPVAETEFARDATFGYRSSDLRDFLAEKSGGRMSRDDVASIGLADIRLGGPDRVAGIVAGLRGRFAVVNATCYDDLDVVVLGVQQAEQRGLRFAYRTGPSFVQALAGLKPLTPLGPDGIWPSGRRPGPGLVVVGSHVGLTSRQVAALRRRHPMTTVELEATTVAGAAGRDPHLRMVTEQVAQGLRDGHVLLMTSRTLVRGRDRAGSLAIARQVSGALVTVVRAVRDQGLAWTVAKGGITSHETAAEGLGIRRAVIEGQLFPGMVSLWRPVVAPDAVLGLPYVVFAGNVGGDDGLAEVVSKLTR
jgi:uncharacterized protein YgbK (DUF1537 family)